MIGAGLSIAPPNVRTAAAAPVAAPVPASAFVALGALSDPASTILDGSDRVSQWTDASGAGNHATQGDALVRPILADDAGGVPGVLMFGGSPDYQRLALAGIPRDAAFHCAVAFRPTTIKDACVLGERFGSYMVSWDSQFGSTRAMQDPMRGTVGEVHVNEIEAAPLTMANHSGDLGAKVFAADTAIVLVRDMYLDTTSGETWPLVDLMLCATNSGLYNFDGYVYGFVAFSDWADAPAALAWLRAQVQANAPPEATGHSMGYDVGARQ